MPMRTIPKAGHFINPARFRASFEVFAANRLILGHGYF